MNDDLKKPDEEKSDEWHLRSIWCAMIREELGGVKADESHVMHQAVHALMGRGYDEDQIIAKVRGL